MFPIEQHIATGKIGSFEYLLQFSHNTANKLEVHLVMDANNKIFYLDLHKDLTVEYTNNV